MAVAQLADAVVPYPVAIALDPVAVVSSPMATEPSLDALGQILGFEPHAISSPQAV